MTSQEARRASRASVFNVIEQITTDSKINRRDLAEEILSALEKAEMIVPFGEFTVHFGSPRAAIEVEDWPDGVRVEKNGSEILAYVFPAEAIISED